MLRLFNTAVLLAILSSISTPQVRSAEPVLNIKLYRAIEKVVGGTEDTHFVFLLMEATQESNGMISKIDSEVRSAVGKTPTTKEIYEFLIDAKPGKPRNFRILRKYKPKYAKPERIEEYRVTQVKLWEKRLIVMRNKHNSTIAYRIRVSEYQSRAQSQMWRFMPSSGSTYTTRTITVYR
ncbi:MAG: hypothetical protein KDA84_02230 [Planctomycetaceae bacterium]|nr:hypothetical protein [Planctomycetaceae bacterium]